MKTTVEIPEALFRQAKAAAARRGMSLKTFLTEALADKVSDRQRRNTTWPVPPPKLAKGEMRRVQSIIDEEFSKIDARDWK